MTEAIFDFSDIRKRTHAFDECPPQSLEVCAGSALKAEPADEGWHVFWDRELSPSELNDQMRRLMGGPKV